MDSSFNVPLPDKFATKDRTFSVNFTCQRCCQPLKLHSSFRELDHQTLSELSVPLYPNADRDNQCALIESFQSQRDESSVMRKIVLPVKFADAGSDFMVVDDLSNLPLDNSQTFRVTTALFNILSDQSDVDHPICEECCDNLLDQMDDNLRTSDDDHRDYREFQEKLEALDKDGGEDDLEDQKEELARLREEAERLEKELALIELEGREAKAALEACATEHERLQREEEARHQDYCRIQRQYLLLEDSHRSARHQMSCAQAQLDRLKYTNVFNATFHIWHSGHFGTINGFRLGRLPNVPVEWAEINAAWGQTVLLLHCLAKKVGLTFERYRLVPYGNHSYVESLENKSRDLPLYCLGGIRYMLDNKFDLAMVAFLDCLQQFKEKVEKEAAKLAINNAKDSFHLPYKMDKGKIEDSCKKTYSIKVQFNSEEQWTKALKFMLTNLKWALAWVSSQSQFSNPQSRS